jgi:hypothetical protein
MKGSKSKVSITVTLIAICLSFSGTARPEVGAPLTAEDVSICLDVVDRSCVDGSDLFPAEVGKLYCFTRICGAKGHIEIDHVWYFGDRERARVKLGVDSANWRTYSSKIIRPHEIGDWHVDVLGPGGELLKVIEFETVQ